MKKKLIISLFLLFIGLNSLSSEPIEMDCDFKIYTPSLFGLVTGNNSFLGLRENPDEVDSCLNFMVETRGSICSIKKMTFSWTFGMGSYIENNINHDNDLLSVDVSLGSGVYVHLFEESDFQLNGLCIYLYPLYQLPIYTESYTPYLNWKSAFDVGYNLTVLNCLTVYPYIRNIFGWGTAGLRYGFDCGVALGFYFKDSYK